MIAWKLGKLIKGRRHTTCQRVCTRHASYGVRRRESSHTTFVCKTHAQAMVLEAAVEEADHDKTPHDKAHRRKKITTKLPSPITDAMEHDTKPVQRQWSPDDLQDFFIRQLTDRHIDTKIFRAVQEVAQGVIGRNRLDYNNDGTLSGTQTSPAGTNWIRSITSKKGRRAVWSVSSSYSMSAQHSSRRITEDRGKVTITMMDGKSYEMPNLVVAMQCSDALHEEMVISLCGVDQRRHL